MGGTLTIRHGLRGPLVLPLSGGVERVMDKVGSGTLLGPEGMNDLPLLVTSPVDASPCGGVDAGDGSLFENCIVDASICGQVFKGARWMPWHQEPMKDVGGHDRPRGAVNRALIRGCPNGETRQSSWAVTHA